MTAVLWLLAEADRALAAGHYAIASMFRRRAMAALRAHLEASP